MSGAGRICRGFPTSGSGEDVPGACLLCGWEEQVQGYEELGQPWATAELEAIVDEHLLHLQPICPHDSTPIVFTSLPNPRRRARYRIACYDCGCQVEVDWPPQETKW